VLPTRSIFNKIDDIDTNYNNDRTLTIVRSTFDWILTQQVPGQPGLFTTSATGQNPFDLYSGSAGVALFALEYHQFDPTDSRASSLVLSIGDFIQRNFDSLIASKFGPHFWHWGRSGLGFVFHKIVRFAASLNASGEQVAVFRAFAERMDREVLEHFETQEVITSGVRHGAAGVALYFIHLLETQEYHDREPQFESQIKASLINKLTQVVFSNAMPVAGHPDILRWYYEGKNGIEAPGYAEGSIGIAHFFAKLYEFTGNQSHFDAALAAGRDLLYLGFTTPTGGFMTPYMVEPQPCKQVKAYLGECNGASGLIKALVSLYKITKDDLWLQKAVGAARYLVDNTQTFNWWVPQDGVSGFMWTTYCVCDGSCAAIEALQIISKYFPNDPLYSKEIQRIMENVIDKHSTTTTGGTFWKQAEWRVEPKVLTSQVGLYVGASGIAHTLLLSVYPELRVSLPDYTF
jgi:lantibiotic modifying enzyme